MSAGRFIDATYLTDSGTPVSIRVQPETERPWNLAGTGAVSPGLPSAQVGKGRNEKGINARKARFKWFGAPPAGYSDAGIITLPIFTLGAFTALVKNTDYAYLGGVLRLSGKTGESIR
jgi:hypothetical protein